MLYSIKENVIIKRTICLATHKPQTPFFRMVRKKSDYFKSKFVTKKPTVV